MEEKPEGSSLPRKETKEFVNNVLKESGIAAVFSLGVVGEVLIHHIRRELFGEQKLLDIMFIFQYKSPSVCCVD